MKRLFFALWPDDETRKRIDQFNQSIKARGLKKVKRNNLHATLVFLGNIDAETQVLISENVQNIRTQSFILNFDQLDYWRKPRILCLTASQHDPKLLALAETIRNAAEVCGIKTEERPYKPHITLARKAVGNVEIEIKPITWRVRSFCLVESCSTPDGVHYQVLKSWSFQC